MEDLDDEHTQDVFISKMTRKDEIRNIVAIEQYSPHDYITDCYKNKDFQKLHRSNGWRSIGKRSEI